MDVVVGFFCFFFFTFGALMQHELKIDQRRSHLSLHEAKPFQNAAGFCKFTQCEERPCSGQVGQTEQITP